MTGRYRDEEEERAHRRPTTESIGPLFEGLEPTARPSDPATSHQAASAIRSYAETQCLQIEEALAHAKDGMTADELDEKVFPTSVSRPAGRRLKEMERANRVMVLDGPVRPTRSGRPARVYVLCTNQRSNAA